MKLNKICRFYVLTFLFVLCFSGIINAQSDVKKISATVVDEKNNPLSQVAVYQANGSRVLADENGMFEISLATDEIIVVKRKGYDSVAINTKFLTDTITLVKSQFLASEDEIIKMGVTERKKRDLVGAVSSIDTKDRLTYDNTQVVRDYISGLNAGVRGSSNIRGIGNALFVIDGVFGRDPNSINMEEVDQITVLKDANSVALYGSQGENGVIIINTKRGEANTKKINVNVRSGIREAISYPEYLDAATFMELRNEAFINDGADPNDSNFPGFSQDQITNTRSGLNPVQFPDVDLYDFAQNFTRVNNIISEFSGGNDKAKYYVNLGWVNSEDWVNVNDDINEGINRFNVRGNIDFRINDWITSSVDAVAIITTIKSSRANILNAATTFLPFDYNPLIPISSIDTSNPENALLLAGANTFDGNLIGTSEQLFIDGADPVLGTAIAGGFQDRIIRQSQFNNGINLDLSSITEGLTAKTYLSFDFLDSFTSTISNQFRSYFIDFNTNELNTRGIDERDLTRSNRSTGFLTRVGAYALLNYDKTFGKHSINSNFLGYYNSSRSDGTIQTNKDAHLGFQVTYDYNKKLYLDFSSSYINSLKLPEGNRGGFSPTLGLAYVLSEENFLKNNNFVNYLKLKASGGIIKSDRSINGFFLYTDNYSQGTNFRWADGIFSNRLQNISQGANPNFTFTDRVDLNIGFETYLMNSLWIEANYFNTKRDNLVTILADQYPSYYNIFRPRDNFNSNLYTGFEAGLNFKKSYKDFTLSLGANFLYSQTEAFKRSESNEFDYQNRQGRELSTIYGFQDLGFYTEDDFQGRDANGNYILNINLPRPNLGTNVQPGDIRYTDQNGDNVIDQDDQIALGQSASPFTYGVNLNLNYKGFNLFVLGTGQTGALGNKLVGFNNYYTPDGNDKYSVVVLDRWTPATASTATFPRLTSGQNQNNFRNSSFWLYDNSFFRINRAQLTYEFSNNLCDVIGLKDFSLNLQGTNLFEFSENKDINQLNIGTNPQFRSYTFGIRASF